MDANSKISASDVLLISDWYTDGRRRDNAERIRVHILWFMPLFHWTYVDPWTFSSKISLSSPVLVSCCPHFFLCFGFWLAALELSVFFESISSFALQRKRTNSSNSNSNKYTKRRRQLESKRKVTSPSSSLSLLLVLFLLLPFCVCFFGLNSEKVLYEDDRRLHCLSEWNSEEHFCFAVERRLTCCKDTNCTLPYKRRMGLHSYFFPFLVK